MKGRIAAIAMALLLVLYLFAVGQLSVALLIVNNPLSQAIGLALLVFPLLGVWALVAELRFGLSSQKLGQIISDEGDLPAESLAHRPSGRPIRSEADAVFPRYRDAVDADPENWKAWFRLGLAYDACGDRRRARSAIRKAIALSR